MQLGNKEKGRLSIVLERANTDNLMTIVSFLGRQGVSKVVDACGHGQGQCKFLSLCGVYRFVQEYLTRTDRSIYMSFYDQPTFLQKEQQHLSHLTQHSPAIIHYLSRCHRTLLARLSTQLQPFEAASYIVDSIGQCLTDPQLPMPKLRKQNIGRHCHSAFQFFLVDRLFPSEGQIEVEETLDDLRIFLGKNPMQGEGTLVGDWSRVGYENYQGFLIGGNLQHNFVVIIVALIDLLVDTINFYIQSIHDPLHAFIEFNLRYCLFRNVILSLEERFGPIFEQLSKQTQEKEGRGTAIWHCALSKWYQHMQVRHEEQFKAYFYLLKKVNLQSIRNSCQARSGEHVTYIELCNRLQIEQTGLLQRQNLMPVYSQIEAFLDEKPQLYKQLIKQYTEYFMDISINEYSVHWCGHSQHHLHLPYQDFQQLILTNYHPYLDKLMVLTETVAQPRLAVDAVLKALIDDLGKEYLKPVTLKKLIDQTQTEVTMVFGEEYYKQMELSKCICALNKEFYSQDKVLEHFNQEVGISNQATQQHSIALEQPQSSKGLQNSASTNTSGPNHPIKEGIEEYFQ